MIDSIAFQLGPLSVRWYGMIMATAFLLGTVVASRQEALQFIESEWFEALCFAVNLEPSAARKHLKNVSAKSGKQGNMA
jgi:prolipoprotein diacylglyceryltransferase